MNYDDEPPHLASLYHPYIDPYKTEYYRESGPKVTQTYDLSSMNEHRRDDKITLRTDAKKRYENKDWSAQYKDFYKAPVQPYIVDKNKGKPYTGPANIFEAQGYPKKVINLKEQQILSSQ